jgi:DNA helicase II / ATP-dependent DNA helicase PcrA
MTSSAAEKILSGLDEQQKVAAKALVGPTVILAGAGTGKTRTVTHRIAYGIATGHFAAHRVLALTYTNRAAGELRSRLRQLGCWNCFC